jgi:O-antigen/teichoic acid export membrane protein
MLFVLLIHQLALTTVSHWVAMRPYRWGWDREIFRRAVSFGWPLVLNGFLMFGTFQGDRVIVGSLIGMTELGWFSAAFSLAMVPSLVVISTLNGFFLPQLSRVQDDEEKFDHMYRVVMQGMVLSSVMLLGVFVVLGPTVLTVLYGAKYVPALPILILLAVVQAMRVVRTGPAIVAMSRAETTNPLLANIVRAMALPVAALVAWHGGGVFGIILTAIAGELLALMAAIYLLRFRLSLNLASLLPSLSAAALVFGIVVLNALIWPPVPDVLGNLHVAHLAILAVFSWMLWHMVSLRSWIGQSLLARQVPTT